MVIFVRNWSTKNTLLKINCGPQINIYTYSACRIFFRKIRKFLYSIWCVFLLKISLEVSFSIGVFCEWERERWRGRIINRTLSMVNNMEEFLDNLRTVAGRHLAGDILQFASVGDARSVGETSVMEISRHGPWFWVCLSQISSNHQS